MDTLLSQDQQQQQRPWLNQELQQQLLDILNSPASISSPFDSSSGDFVPSSDSSTSPTVQQCEGDGFNDPILQYINRLLMEEDMEDNKCSLHDSMAYQATVKSLSDILNDKNEHLSSSTFTYGEDFRATEQDGYPLSTAEGHYRQEAEELNVDRVEVHWRKGLPEMVSEINSVKPSETEFCLQQGKIYHGSQAFGPQAIIDLGSEYSTGHVLPESCYRYENSEACVPGNTNGNSKRHVSNESFKQQYSNERLGQKILNGSLESQVSNESWKRRTLNGSFRQQVLSSLKHHASCTHSRSTLPGQLTERYYPFKVSTEECLPLSANHEMSFKNLPVSTDSSRLKRSSPEGKNSIDDDTDNGQEDSVSFVQNEDLKAEEYAKALNEGLTEIVERLKKIGPKTSVSPPKWHKSNALKLATTADLKNMLLCCAQAVGDGKTRRANEILKEIRQEATPYGNDLQRVAHYFAEGLVARITGTGAVVYTALSNNMPSTARWLKAHHTFVDSSPFYKIWNFFANRAIVESAKDACRLHIIDYGIMYGVQWPSLISALAERKGGPPFLRMTMIELPDPGNNPAGRVEWTGKKLSEYAMAYGVPFEYQAIADRWDTITASSVGLRDGEILVVNCMFRLHQVPDESVMPHDPRTTILKNILEMNPKIFIHGVLNATYTSPFFLPRFREALSSYYTTFDVLEAILPRDSQERLMLEREFFGVEIINVVACEGQERVVRPVTYKQWQSRMQSVGFAQMFLDEKMVKDVQDIVRLHYNKNFSIDTDGNWMLVGWKGKVRNAMTLWRPR